MFSIISPSRDNLATRIFKSYTFLRQRCVSAFLLSILLLSRHSNRPITMVHPTTMVTIVMPKTIHRQTCPVCFLCSILLLIFYNSTTFWYDLICLNWQSYGWNVTIKNFRSIYNNFYGIKTFMGMRWRWRGLQSYNWAYKDLCIISYKKGLCHFTQSLFERILISLYWLQLYSSDKFLLYYCI